MAELITDPQEIEGIYEEARRNDAPYNRVGINVKRRMPFHLIDQNDQPYLDYHSQILCDSLGDVDVQKRIREMIGDVGMTTFGPDFTHPILDQAQIKIAKLLSEAGWGDYDVAFHSSGTRANEDALRYGRAFLGAQMHIVVLKEGYHGAGLLNQICGHASWKGDSTVPLGTPVVFLDHNRDATAQGSENLRRTGYEQDFERALQCDMAANAKPYFLAEGGVQGVAGFRVLDPESLREVAKMVHDRGGIVHYDLVQTMPFRTGDNMLCTNRLVDPSDPATIPDIVTSAKGNGAGEPFAFVAVAKTLLKQIDPKALGKGYDTHGRNLRGAAAFNVVHDAIIQPEFQKKLGDRAEQLRTGLYDLACNHRGKVTGPTGTGMMQGLQLDSAQRVAAFKQEGLKNDINTAMVVGAGGVKGNVLRLCGRLDPTKEIIQALLKKMDAILGRI